MAEVKVGPFAPKHKRAVAYRKPAWAVILFLWVSISCFLASPFVVNESSLVP